MGFFNSVSVVQPSLQVFLSFPIVRTAIYYRLKLQYELCQFTLGKDTNDVYFRIHWSLVLWHKGCEALIVSPTRCYISCPRQNLLRCLISLAFFQCPYCCFVSPSDMYFTCFYMRLRQIWYILSPVYHWIGKIGIRITLRLWTKSTLFIR